MVGTRNKIAKIQYPIPTRQINSRLNINFKPTSPSTIAVIIIPAIEDEKTEANASSEGSLLHITKYTVPAPSATAKIKNEIIGYLCAKLGFDIFSKVVILLTFRYPTMA
jgi:hypothetical protein